MKTIHERAEDYANRETLYVECGEYSDRTIVEAYVQGATDERALLTEWHDPKEPPKEEYMTILLRFRYNKHIQRYMYCTGFYGSGLFVVDDRNFNANNITGWRYIHENE